MDQKKAENKESTESLESLDTPQTIESTPETAVPTEQTSTADVAGDDVAPAPDTTVATSEKVEKKKHVNRGIERLAGLNIYLLGFALVLVLAVVVTFIAYSRNKKEEKKQASLITEPLSQEALDQLKQTDVRVGDPKQILSIESNAIFAGKVLIRDDLEVAGQLKLGGPLELPGISVTGASTFNQVQAKDLQIAGNGKIQGQFSVEQNLTVGGSLSVAGPLTAAQLTIQNLQVGGDLQLAKHIDAGGGTPGISRGSALGGGGTTSVSGTDTAGTVNVNTGGGPGPGCFATLTFTQAFGSTPHVVITPVGGAGASVNYYVNRSSTGFSICTTNSASAGQSFAFDYIVID